MNSSRREFLKTTAAAGAAASVPFIWTSKSARAQQPDSRPTVACIGVGGSRGQYARGSDIGEMAARYGRIIAVCDVDNQHNEEFKGRLANGRRGRGGRGGRRGAAPEQTAQAQPQPPSNPYNQVIAQIKNYSDYRELLAKEKPQIVTIGTTDHWHVPIAVACLEAGCDVYCEKPLTLTIEEGNLIRDAVKRTGKVFQVGSQQRSAYNQMFLKTVALVQSGRLGKNLKVHIALGSGPNGGPFETRDVPSDINWDLWVGPSQDAAYTPERMANFRWYYDNSGGQLTDWGAHHVDIMQWALGFQNTNPVKISGTCKYPSVVPEKFDWAAYFAGEAKLPTNAYHTATNFSMNMEYANGTVVTVHDNYDAGDGRTRMQNGILIEGDNGRIMVNRQRLTGAPVENLTEADNKELSDLMVKIYGGTTPWESAQGETAHMKNFFDCIESRKLPISDVYTHVRSMNTLHLLNICMLLGREVKWDPDKEAFVGDAQATALMSRPRREKYSWNATAKV
jgi:predicted dehydrogenase